LLRLVANIKSRAITFLGREVQQDANYESIERRQIGESAEKVSVGHQYDKPIKATESAINERGPYAL